VSFFPNRNLSHRITEADRRAVSPRRFPRKQRGGHQRSAHHRRAAGRQAAVLPKPVAHGHHPTNTWGGGGGDHSFKQQNPLSLVVQFIISTSGRYAAKAYIDLCKIYSCFLYSFLF